jgi:hypothetical protein
MESSIALPLAYGHLTLGNIVKERKDIFAYRKTFGYVHKIPIYFQFAMD